MIESVDRVLDPVRVYKLYLLCLMFCRGDVGIECSIGEVQKIIITESLKMYTTY